MNILQNPNVVFVYGGLFSSDGMWIHPDRVEKTYEILYVTSGEVYMNIGGENCRAAKGQLLLLAPDVRHYGCKQTENVSFYWLHFTLSSGALPFEQRFWEHFDSSHLFKELLHYHFLPTPPHALVGAILIRILAEMQFLSETPLPASDKAAEEIYEWMRANVSAKLTAERTARHFGFSPDHVSRLLKSQYAVGAKALIDTFLLSRAKELLANTGKYVKEIAYELAFDSDKAFIGFFKYHEGVYPSEFRNRFYRIHMNSR